MRTLIGVALALFTVAFMLATTAKYVFGGFQSRRRSISQFGQYQG